MKNAIAARPRVKPETASSDDVWWTGGDVDLTKNTKERLAYHESLGEGPSAS